MTIKRILALCIILGFALPSIAQDYEYNISPQVEAYLKMRERTTTPPYGLAKIQELIKGITPKEIDSDFGLVALSDVQFNNLSAEEQFTYVMIHPENFAQNCDAIMPDATADKKIFGYLMSWGNEAYWSERQVNYLKNNKSTVMRLIKESTDRSKHMGVNYKDALIEMNAWEMIPYLIKYYKSNPKDKDALTVLLQLMEKGKYEPFMKSTSYKKLYSEEYNYESFLAFNKPNEALIIERANGYYKQKKK